MSPYICNISVLSLNRGKHPECFLQLITKFQAHIIIDCWEMPRKGCYDYIRWLTKMQSARGPGEHFKKALLLFLCTKIFIAVIMRINSAEVYNITNVIISKDTDSKHSGATQDCLLSSSSSIKHKTVL